MCSNPLVVLIWFQEHEGVMNLSGYLPRMLITLPWAVVADAGSPSVFFGHGEAAGTQHRRSVLVERASHMLGFQEREKNP